MVMELDSYIRKVASKIEKVAGDITVAGYIFGSTLKGRGFKGDLDVGLLVEKEALEKGMIKVQNKIYMGLRKELGREDIDVVILNDAPPLLRYAVVKDGVLVYERDRDERIEFEVRTMLEYFDFQRIRKMFWNDMLERLKDGRFAKPYTSRVNRSRRGRACPSEEEADDIPR